MKIRYAKLSVSEIRQAVRTLRVNERKPQWRFTWEFPFLKKFWIIYPEDSAIGNSIDYYVKQLLKK